MQRFFIFMHIFFSSFLSNKYPVEIGILKNLYRKWDYQWLKDQALIYIKEWKIDKEMNFYLLAALFYLKDNSS